MLLGTNVCDMCEYDDYEEEISFYGMIDSVWLETAMECDLDTENGIPPSIDNMLQMRLIHRIASLKQRCVDYVFHRWNDRDILAKF